MSIFRSNQYVMLISSLPLPGDPLQADQTAISYLKLQSRLKMLEEADFERLTQLAALIAWARLPMDKTDRDIIESARLFCSTERRPVIRQIIESMLDINTIMSALRRRKLGASRAPQTKFWGYGQWTAQIERNWNHPTFKLEAYFDWIAEADRLMHADESLELEKLMLTVNWTLLNRLSAGHYFDFEAVVVYVLRWEMIKRWTGMDSERALSRFRDMTKAGMGKYANLYEGN